MVITMTPLLVPVFCIGYFTSLCPQILGKRQLKGGNICFLAHGFRDVVYHCGEGMASGLAPIYGIQNIRLSVLLSQQVGIEGTETRNVLWDI